MIQHHLPDLTGSSGSEVVNHRLRHQLKLLRQPWRSILGWSIDFGRSDNPLGGSKYVATQTNGSDKIELLTKHSENVDDEEDTLSALSTSSDQYLKTCSYVDDHIRQAYEENVLLPLFDACLENRLSLIAKAFKEFPDEHARPEEGERPSSVNKSMRFFRLAVNGVSCDADNWVSAEAGLRNESEIQMIVVVLVSMLYEGLHAAAWNNHFPTSVEQQLWRVCSVVIASSPIVLLLMRFCGGGHELKLSPTEMKSQRWHARALIATYNTLEGRSRIEIKKLLLPQRLDAESLHEPDGTCAHMIVWLLIVIYIFARASSS